jgi:UDP-hydrolysing UDP-N-acetyl-D-glucosamine 2-epimerase
MRRSIAVITTSRADYSHLYWLLKELSARPQIDLHLIAFGPHLSPEFGHTITEIERDGFRVNERIECLLSSDSDIGMAKTIGVATLSLADALGRLRPDLLVIIADRYEMLAPAAVALALRIPIAHIEGGDVTEGAIDDAVRNALTKMSHLHFTTTEAARRRVLAMGEEAWRVHQVGSLSLDHLRRSRLPARDELEAALGLTLSGPLIVCTYHPATLAMNDAGDAEAVFAALAELPQPILFCYPNADAGSRALIARIQAFCAANPRARLFINLPHTTYLGLLGQAALFIGNSSSGIMETPSFRLPTVNIGARQRGRERAANVLDAAADAVEIRRQVGRALAPEFVASLTETTNPYGDGHAAERIADMLARAPLGSELLIKRAVDVSE